jgi:hypothetical protein
MEAGQRSRPPTLPHTCASTTGFQVNGTKGLNFRRRDGNGRDSTARSTKTKSPAFHRGFANLIGRRLARGGGTDRVLLSYTLARAVPSGLKGLTSVFGMGAGETPQRDPQKTKSPGLHRGFANLIGRRPTLPHTCACSTIGAEGLNFRVRDGNGWDPFATITQSRKKSEARNQNPDVSRVSAF